MINDSQCRRWNRPQLWSKPEELPRAAFQQLPEQGTVPLLEYAGLSGPRADHLGRGRRRHTPNASILYAGAVGHNPGHRYRQPQPMPPCSNRVRPPGVFPLPANAFQGAEAQFDPDPQTVPTNADALRWQVGQQNPRLDLVIPPNHNQDPTATQFRAVESSAGSYPAVAWPGHQGAGGHATASLGLENGVAPDAHQRVPTQGLYLFAKTGAPQTTVGQHQYRHVLWDGWPQEGQQVQSRSYPRARPVTGQDMPCHRDGATPVEHTDHHCAQTVTMGGGVNGQSQLIPSPPTQQPPKQRRKAKPYLQLGLAGRGFIFAIVKPLSEVLPQGVPSANSQQGRDNCILATAVAQNGPEYPKGKTPLLRRPEAGEMIFNSLTHLITFSRKAHEPLPLIPVVHHS